jgi:25S rRNA (uracil2634-N3)-methyltransferase
MGKKGSLKLALSSQQTRLKKKQEVVQAAQIAKQRGKKVAVAANGKERTTSALVVIPFKVTDKILLVGEGNFSFTRALVCDPPSALQYLPPSSVVATAYDTEAQCFEKYTEARAIVEELRGKGVEVIFGVDATKLEKNAALRGRKFDKIMWNFPHTGKCMFCSTVRICQLSFYQARELLTKIETFSVIKFFSWHFCVLQHTYFAEVPYPL